jgi:hypothetical protein
VIWSEQKRVGLLLAAATLVPIVALGWLIVRVRANRAPWPEPDARAHRRVQAQTGAAVRGAAVY